MDKSKQQRYRENNPKNVEFSQLKQNVKRQNLKETDPEKADLVREANRKRKAAERARKKATKENIDPVDSESSAAGNFIKTKNHLFKPNTQNN